MEPIAIETLADRIGDERVSGWITVDQDMIDRFAQATHDHQFIHVDPQRAAQTPFGGTIAHGFLTLSLASAMAADTDQPPIAALKMGVNYGANRIRFLAPVRSGKRVRGRFKLLSIEQKRPGQWQQVNEITIEIEDEETPALVAEWITQMFVDAE